MENVIEVRDYSPDNPEASGEILFFNCHGFKPVVIKKKIETDSGSSGVKKHKGSAPKNKKSHLVL